MMEDGTPAIGINFGTTFSSVAVFQQGQAVIITNDNGSKSTHSSVTFSNTAGFVIGESPTSDILAKNPSNNIVYCAKRLVGRRFDDPAVEEDMKQWPFEVINHNGKPKIQVDYNGEKKTFFPEEICSMIMLKMKEIAESYLGTAVTNAVISVPASYDDSQRRAMKDAAKIAGLNVLRLINDTSATAIAYSFQNKVIKESKKKDVLIFDLGGGSFDVTVVSIKPSGKVFKVKSTRGNTHLGGDNFTDRMVKYFIEEVKKKHGVDVSTSKTALFRLRSACEEAKQLLSTSEEAAIVLDSLIDGLYGFRIDFHSSITRKRFEDINYDLFKAVLKLVAETVEHVETFDQSKIQEIILVGGSVHIPTLQSRLKTFFYKKELNMSLKSEEAVAFGAAVLAASLQDDKPEILTDFALFDVAPVSLGVGLEGDIMSKLVKRNDSIPLTRKHMYDTTLDINDSTFKINIYEGEHPMVDDNKFLCKLAVNGLPPARHNQCEAHFEITFNISEDGILDIAAVDVTPGSQSTISINYEDARLLEEDVAQAAVNAERYRLDVNQLRDRTEAKNNLESYCKDVKSRLERTAKPKSNIVKKCNEALKLIGKDKLVDKQGIDEKREEIERLLQNMAACLLGGEDDVVDDIDQDAPQRDDAVSIAQSVKRRRESHQ